MLCGFTVVQQKKKIKKIKKKIFFFKQNNLRLFTFSYSAILRSKAFYLGRLYQFSSV